MKAIEISLVLVADIHQEKNVGRSHMAMGVRLLTFKATGSIILSFFIYSVVTADGRKHSSRQHEFPETETGRRRREEVFYLWKYQYQNTNVCQG